MWQYVTICDNMWLWQLRQLYSSLSLTEVIRSHQTWPVTLLDFWWNDLESSQSSRIRLRVDARWKGSGSGLGAVVSVQHHIASHNHQATKIYHVYPRLSKIIQVHSSSLCYKRLSNSRCDAQQCAARRVQRSFWSIFVFGQRVVRHPSHANESNEHALSNLLSGKLLWWWLQWLVAIALYFWYMLEPFYSDLCRRAIVPPSAKAEHFHTMCLTVCHCFLWLLLMLL